ncbi:PD40 domain-containing protein [Lysobacter capsici]|uniref:PD40 domain-containing protein n=1 Tax=Lysobacter capsici TaxID=435897 RepID=UPI000BBA741C|nr:PD40 domain-containing protein [Lysobacter capsici]ATE72710.1 hypothetical protein CNO08_15955 [Lysobacter capsici]
MPYSNRLAAAIIVGLLPIAVTHAQPQLRLVSHAYNNSRIGAHGADPVVSANGRFVAFRSTATNLIANPDSTMAPDTNNAPDMFVYNLDTGVAKRVSVTSLGAEANGISYGRPAISGDGRYVAFTTRAPNLIDQDLPVPNGTYNHTQIILYDTLTRTSKLVSRSANNRAGDRSSENPSFSADGRFLVFDSSALNLVGSEQEQRGLVNVFRYAVGTDPSNADGNGLTLVSRDINGEHSSPGSSYPEISANGSRVTFNSSSTQMITPATSPAAAHIYVRDLPTQTNSLLDRKNALQTGIATSGPNAWSAISGDGRVTAFSSGAPNLRVNMDTPGNVTRHYVFVRDTREKGLRMATLYPNEQTGPVGTWWPALNEDGRWLAFVARQGGELLRPEDPRVGVYRRDMTNDTTEWVTVPLGNRGNHDDSGRPSINSDGQVLTFHTSYADLVPNVQGSGSVMVYTASWR